MRNYRIYLFIWLWSNCIGGKKHHTKTVLLGDNGLLGEVTLHHSFSFSAYFPLQVGGTGPLRAAVLPHPPTETHMHDWFRFSIGFFPEWASRCASLSHSPVRAVSPRLPLPLAVGSGITAGREVQIGWIPCELAEFHGLQRGHGESWHASFGLSRRSIQQSICLRVLLKLSVRSFIWRWQTKVQSFLWLCRYL